MKAVIVFLSFIIVLLLLSMKNQLSAQELTTTKGQKAKPLLEIEINVPGRAPWTDTGIDLKTGQYFEISAAGTVWANAEISTGPDGITGRKDWEVYCVIRGKPHEGLIAKIGADGEPFFAGSKGQWTVKNTGRLYFGVNDNDLGNNKGSFEVRIWVYNESPDAVIVKGTQTWTETSVFVEKGQSVALTASGKVWANASVNCGPAGVKDRPDWDVYCIVKGKPPAGLIARIGKSEPVFIGEAGTITAQDSGILFLGVNDSDVGNNKGEFEVFVSRDIK